MKMVSNDLAESINNYIVVMNVGVSQPRGAVGKS